AEVRTQPARDRAPARRGDRAARPPGEDRRGAAPGQADLHRLAGRIAAPVEPAAPALAPAAAPGRLRRGDVRVPRAAALAREPLVRAWRGRGGRFGATRARGYQLHISHLRATAGAREGTRARRRRLVAAPLSAGGGIRGGTGGSRQRTPGKRKAPYSR